MAITITEILGTDSISGSRLTINSNFLILENAYNDLENTFNINVETGSIDVSAASSGQIKAKNFIGNGLVMPSSGTPTIQIYGTGASAGNIILSGTISGGTGAFSTFLSTNGMSASGPANFGGTATFSSTLTNDASFINGASGTYIEKNRKASVGSATPFSSPPSSGVTGTYNNPYLLTLTERVIYAQCDYVDGGYTGFFMYATTGLGATASAIPAGYTLTVINTGTGTGYIPTGVTGPSTYYYTGFSTGDGQYSGAPGITLSGSPYKNSVTLMWEPRIGQGSIDQKGSWVVVSDAGSISY